MASAWMLDSSNALAQPLARLLLPLRLADDADDLVDVVQRLDQPLGDVGLRLGLLQLMGRAPLDHLDAVVAELLQHLLQRHLPGDAVVQRQHDGAERGLHVRLLVERVQHRLDLGAPLQLHHDAHPVAVALVAEVAHVVQLLASGPGRRSAR
jgi:hypothetical protein